MALAFHGNYCGPGWSAGKYQTSVVSDVAAVDEFDFTCKQHDAAYALGTDLLSADLNFARQNITTGLFGSPKRLVAGVAVGVQGLARAVGILPSSDTVPLNPVSTPPPTMPRHRAGALATRMSNLPVIVEKPAKQKHAKIKTMESKLNKLPSVRISTAPVSIGTTIQSSKPTTRLTAQGVVVTHREFLCSVYESNNTNWQLSACAPLNPAYYAGGVMGNFCRSFGRFRWRRVVIHFVTRQPTTVTGEIALVYTTQALLPAENGASANFLARVMTRGNAILGPLWTSHSIEVPCDSVYRNVSAIDQPNYTDNVMGEVQAYTLSSVSDTAGYLLIDYELEFCETLYAPQSTLIPIPSGPGQSFTLTDNVATPTVTNAAAFNAPAILSNLDPGAVWAVIINADESTPATGTTLANAWNVSIDYGTSTSTVANSQRSLPIVDGFRIFILMVGGGVFYAYTSLEAAITGDGSGQVYYATTGSTAAVWLCNGFLVRAGPQRLPSTS